MSSEEFRQSNYDFSLLESKWDVTGDTFVVATIDNNEKQSPNPTQASNKLGGSLSPELLSKEFPKQYGDSKQESPKHPATQLQEILNLFGEECWELFEI